MNKYFNNSKTLIEITTLLLIFVFLIFRNSAESISGDEAYSIFNALTSFENIINLSMADQNPPLYLLILKIWTGIFGISELATRSLSAVFSTLSIAVLFHLVKRTRK